MKLRLHPELVPPYIDGFLIQSDLWQSRFSAVASQPSGTTAIQAEHSRVELELNVALRGRADYLVGQQRVALSAGQMLWLLPQQNRLVIGTSADFSAWVLVFRRRLVRRVCTRPASQPLRRTGNRHGVLLGRVPQSEVQELAALYAGVPVGQGRDVFNAGLAYALARSWSAYLRSSVGHHVPRHVHPAVQQAAWLLRDAKEPVDSRALATSVGLSRARLSRVFKKEMGLPLAEFRNRQRLQLFLNAIERSPEGNLLELALDSGFGSYAQFHRVFCKHVGSSPSRYLDDRRQRDLARVAERLMERAAPRVSRAGALAGPATLPYDPDSVLQSNEKRKRKPPGIRSKTKGPA